mgnify:CR=1 FL=1
MSGRDRAAIEPKRKVRIRRASREELPEAVDIVRQVHKKMEENAWFAVESFEVFDRWMAEDKGLLYLAEDVDSGECGGMFFVILPGMDHENLGYDIGMENADLEKVALMDTAAVLHQFRGLHLQYRMMQEAERDLRQAGYRFLMCTVHPENRFSRQNVIDQGYRKVLTKEKYGGYLRDIWMKEI